MIPLKDDNPTNRFPIVTVLLVALNIVVFLYELTLGPTALEAFIRTHAFIPADFLADPFSVQQWMTVFAAMFMHAGFLHIGGNMLYLWIFGNNVEDRMGSVPFLLFYLLAGFAATVAQAFAAPASTVPNLGASGAIAGVLGSYILLYPGAAVLTLIPIFFFIEVARIPAFVVIGFWFVLQLANGIASLAPAISQGGVAYFAHIGGFAAGLAVALPLALLDRSRRRQAQFRA